MRSLNPVAVLLFLLALTASAAGETVFATEGDYPPWNETVAGKLTGFDVELVSALCNELGTDCRMVTATFPAMLDELAADKFDAVISGIAITDERRQKIAFTRPYMSLSVSFAVAAGSALAQAVPTTTAATLERLAAARIGAQRGTVNAELVQRLLPAATLVLFDDQSGLTRAVGNGDVDAGIAATQTWVHAPTDLAAKIATVGPPFASAAYPVLGEGLAIGIAKENDELKGKLDSAICHLTGTGTVSALSVKWFGADLSVPCAGKPN